MAEDVQKHIRTYLLVFASLLVLTGVTVAVAQFHLAEVERIAVAMVVAVIKSTLVAGIFMHLFKEHSRHIRVPLALTAAFFTVLLGLSIVARTDSFRITG